MYPKSNVERNSDFLSIFLNSLGDKVFTVTSFTFEILNQKNKVVTNFTSHENTEFRGNDDWGTSLFAKRDVVLNKASGVLNDDKLTI